MSSSTTTRTPRKRGKLFGEARRADKYHLYQIAVQDPETDVELARRIFRKRFGRVPHRLREDFCGTAAICCRWVEEDPANEAWGIDLDPEPLGWGREHNLAAMEPEARARVHLIQGDVREVDTEPVDVTVAFNFSYFLFRKRAELRAYLAKARSTLAPEGMLMLDVYGGSDAFHTLEETREQDDFDYVWDQHRFDPVHHEATNYIHFQFQDGSELRRAFAYHWRVWTLPELRDLLEEVGFSDVEVYWEGTDRETGEGDGTYHKVDRATDDPAWIAYVVAYR